MKTANSTEAPAKSKPKTTEAEKEQAKKDALEYSRQRVMGKTNG